MMMLDDAPQADTKPDAEVITSYKGFDLSMQCRGFQFEVGKTYEHTGDVKACSSGFHACEYPLDVLPYYAPGVSQYAVVSQSGAISRHSDDTKIASAKITIEATIALPQLIERAVKWVMDHAKPEGGSQATGYSGAASATGDSGAASALFLVYRNPNTAAIEHAWAGIAGRNGIKPMTWYMLDESGSPVEVG